MASGSGWNLWVWLAKGGCGWNLWVWLVGVVVRRYIDFLIILIPTPLVSASLLFVHLKKCFSFLYIIELVDSICRDDRVLRRSNTLQTLEYLTLGKLSSILLSTIFINECFSLQKV